MPRAQIKDEKTYRSLRKKGESKEKSARIANASAGSSRRTTAAKGGKWRVIQRLEQAGSAEAGQADRDQRPFCHE